MAYRFTYFLASCILAIVSAGCTKIPENDMQSTYTFSNNTGKQLNFDLYDNRADYGNNANRLEHLVMAPGASNKLTLNVGKSYWIDWYTDDFAYTNWDLTNNNATPRPELKVADIDDTRTISAVYRDSTRSIMLTDGNVPTNWKGTATGTGAFDGVHEFTFKKDFSGIHTYTPSGGTPVTQAFNFRIYTISRDFYYTYYFSLSIERGGLQVFRANCNLKNMTPLTGRNSLQIIPTNNSGSGVSFLVNRQ